jgi:DNA-binding SARP family transcriptional activator
VDIRLLGPLRAVDGAGHAIEIAGKRQRAILALLAIHAPRPVAVGAVAAAVWPEAALANPAASVHVAINRLRALLGEDVIGTSGAGYRLEVPIVNTDVERFRILARRGRQLSTLGQPTRATEAFRQALDQWRGSALEDVQDHEFAVEAARMLDEERIATVERLRRDV